MPVLRAWTPQGANMAVSLARSGPDGNDLEGDEDCESSARTPVSGYVQRIACLICRRRMSPPEGRERQELPGRMGF